MTQVTAESADGSQPDRWPLIRRFFAYLEVNAGEFWEVPVLDGLADDLPKKNRSRSLSRIHWTRISTILMTMTEHCSIRTTRTRTTKTICFATRTKMSRSKTSADDGVSGELMEDGASTGSTEMEYLSKRAGAATEVFGHAGSGLADGGRVPDAQLRPPDCNAIRKRPGGRISKTRRR